MVHIVHVVLTGIMTYAQFGVESGKLKQFVGHGEDTPYDHSALGVNPYITLKHLRKSLIHPSGYLSVLFSPEGSQFAETLV